MKKSNKVMGWFLAGFMLPAMPWMGFNWYFDIWSQDETIKIMFSLWMWVYIIIVNLIVFVTVNRKLHHIHQYYNNPNESNKILAQKSLAFLPKFFLIGMALYCIIGPNVALMGQTLGDRFMDNTEYAIAEILGIPLTLFFSIYFFVNMSINLEKFASDVPISSQHKFFSLRAKMITVFVFNLVGIIFSTALATVSIIHKVKYEVMLSVAIEKIIILGILLLATSLVNLMLLIKQLVQPTNQLSEAFQNISSQIAEGKGDLTKKIEIYSKDEIGVLAQSVNDFISFLSQILLQIKQTTEKTKDISSNLLSTSDKSTKALENIRSNVERVQKQAIHMDEEVNQSNLLANEVNSFISNVSNQISSQASAILESSKSVENISTSILSIAETTEKKMALVKELEVTAIKGEGEMNESMEVIHKVAESANIIMEMISVINAIAEQTNLLAMNAAIEAAHAGDAGRGFAVVADEIRKLAEDSGKNAKEISNSLKEVIQFITSSEISIGKTGNSFNQIVTGVKGVAESILEVKEAMQELSMGSQEIKKTLGTLVSATEEVKESSVNMKGNVDHIKKSVDSLSLISTETKDGMEYVTVSVKELYQLIELVSSAGSQNAKSLYELEHLVMQFQVEKEHKQGVQLLNETELL